VAWQVIRSLANEVFSIVGRDPLIEVCLLFVLARESPCSLSHRYLCASL
jgi:hypothetical protein